MAHSLDDEIDALYQVPAGEFTAARNALAKRAGARGGEIRALARPQAAAWAVNQIYWHRRAVFDALVRASDSRRAAHVQQLYGEAAGVAAADARHRAALDAASDAAVAALRETGDALSPATLDAISRTLEAVPAPDIRGRLVRPIEPVGFSVLASLMTGSAHLPSSPPGDVVLMKRRNSVRKEKETEHAPTKSERGQARRTAEAARRTAEARRREHEQLTRELQAAQAAEQRATEALKAARGATAAAHTHLDQLEQEAAQARNALAERREEAERARRAVNETATARVRIERKLREIEG